MELYSKKNPFYYFSLAAKLVVVVACCGFAVVFFYKLATKGYDKGLFILMTGGYFIGALCIYSTNLQLKRVHNFSVTKSAITIRGIRYAIADITDINFTGKMPYGSMEKTEGMQITFNGNKILYVYDRYYSNIAEIKNFLERSLQQQAPPQNQVVNIPDEVYKGGLWGGTTITSFTFIGVGLLLLIAIEGNQKWLALIFPAMGFLLLTLHCHYFVIEDDSLIIKKFTLPIYSKSFRLKEIKEVIFETGYRKPYGLRLIKNDYSKSSVYYAATFYNRHWKELKGDLERAGITVRDEIGITKI